MDLMKFDNTNSLVVLDDQSNSKKFNSFENIETVNPRIESSFPTRGTVEIGLGKKKFNMEAENASYDRDWDWDANPDGPPKDNEEIFSDFFGEMFFSNNRLALNKYLLPEQIEDNYSGYYVFGKKNYLDSQKKTIFNNIKFLYFYKISREFLGTDSKPFTLPKSINTANVELLYLSEGQIIDFDNEITPNKFPNLRILVINTEIKKGGKFPSFKNLEEIYINKDLTLYQDFLPLNAFSNPENLAKYIVCFFLL